MRRFTLPIVIVASILVAALLTWIALSSANFGNRTPRAESPGGRETMVADSLPSFRRIEVSGSADVTLVQGETESVSFGAASRKQGAVRAEVRGDTLHIRAGDRAHWWTIVFGNESHPSQVVVTFKEIDSIEAAGTVKLSAGALKAGDLRISGAGGTSVRIDDLTARQLTVNGAGALKAELAGRADDQDVTISGAGTYRGARLVTQNAKVTVSGAGKVVVNAEKTLRATISGAGSVEYLGDPAVTERVSGAGSVRRRSATDRATRVAFAD
ncbi:MAG: head GIN domain-containing protein [Burkholderiales bacterium]